MEVMLSYFAIMDKMSLLADRESLYCLQKAPPYFKLYDKSRLRVRGLKRIDWVGEVAQQIKELTSKPDDQSFMPRTHMKEN